MMSCPGDVRRSDQAQDTSAGNRFYFLNLTGSKLLLIISLKYRTLCLSSYQTLSVTELNDPDDPENKECLTVLLGVRELVDESVAGKQLWSGRFSWACQKSRRGDQINDVLNTTCLNVSHDNIISSCPPPPSPTDRQRDRYSTVQYSTVRPRKCKTP